MIIVFLMLCTFSYLSLLESKNRVMFKNRFLARRMQSFLGLLSFFSFFFWIWEDLLNCWTILLLENRKFEDISLGFCCCNLIRTIWLLHQTPHFAMFWLSRSFNKSQQRLLTVLSNHWNDDKRRCQRIHAKFFT